MNENRARSTGRRLPAEPRVSLLRVGATRARCASNWRKPACWWRPVTASICQRISGGIRRNAQRLRRALDIFGDVLARF